MPDMINPTITVNAELGSSWEVVDRALLRTQIALLEMKITALEARQALPDGPPTITVEVCCPRCMEQQIAARIRGSHHQ